MVLQDNRPHLLHLIRFCVRAVALQVDPLLDPGTREDVVASPRSLGESKPKKKTAELFKPDTRVRGSQKNPLERLVTAGHS